MRIRIEELEHLLARSASKYVTLTDAEYFAKCTLHTHFRKAAPRVNPLEYAIDDLNNWRNRENTDIKTEVDHGSISVLNFNGLAPSLKIKTVHDTLAHKARKNGIAAAGFYNSAGVEILFPWAAGLVEQDLIGIAMFNGGCGYCVPYGGCRGVFGTNPLAYAIPTSTDPIILDMATTEMAFFELKHAKEKGCPLRPNVAVNHDGQPTVDPSQALTDDDIANLLPIGGGFKGYGLVLLVEILTGPLVSSLLSTQQTSGWNPTECGCLVIAIDIKSFTDPVKFKTSLTVMCERLRSMHPAEGFDTIKIPGDRGLEKMKEIMQQGELEVDYKMVRELEELARKTAH